MWASVWSTVTSHSCAAFRSTPYTSEKVCRARRWSARLSVSTYAWTMPTISSSTAAMYAPPFFRPFLPPEPAASVFS